MPGRTPVPLLRRLSVASTDCGQPDCGQHRGGRHVAGRRGAAGTHPARPQLHQRGRVRPRAGTGAAARLVLRGPRRRPGRAGLLPGRRRVRGEHHRDPGRRRRPGGLLQPVPAPRLAAGAHGRVPARGQRAVSRQCPLPLPRLDLRPGRDAARRAVPARAARVPGRAVAAPGGRGHLGRVRVRPARAARPRRDQASRRGYGRAAARTDRGYGRAGRLAGGHCGRDRGPDGRLSAGRPALRGPVALRRGRQLEGHPGELQRVLPLRPGPPGTVRASAGLSAAAVATWTGRRGSRTAPGRPRSR